MVSADVAAVPFRLGRRPWLDGMRAFAVLSVVAYHERFLLPRSHIPWVGYGGNLGVDVFFAISGFLITSLLLEERRRTGAVGLGGFYSRRARRLFPAVGALLAVIVIGALVFASPDGRSQMLEEAAATATYSANWTQAFGLTTPLHQLSHTWSLAVEEQFYLLWPLALLGLLAIGLRGRRLAVFLSGLALVAVLWRTEAAPHLHWSPVRIYAGFDTRCDGLLIGCALAVAMHHRLLPTGAGITWIRRALGVAGAMAIIALIHNPLVINNVIHLTPIDASAVVGLSTAAIIWALVEESDSLPARVLSWRPIAGTGRISYGIYLYSYPVSLLMSRQIGHRIGARKLVVLDVALTFAIALLSYFTIERVFRRPHRAEPPEPVAPPAGATVAGPS